MADPDEPRSLGRCYGWCRFSHRYAQLTTPTLPTIQRYTGIANAEQGIRSGPTLGTQYKHSTVQSKPRAMDTHRGCSWCLSNGVGPRDSIGGAYFVHQVSPAHPRLLISGSYAGCLHTGPLAFECLIAEYLQPAAGGSW